jgi:hypothetical protein
MTHLLAGTRCRLEGQLYAGSKPGASGEGEVQPRRSVLAGAGIEPSLLALEDLSALHDERHSFQLADVFEGISPDGDHVGEEAGIASFR